MDGTSSPRKRQLSNGQLTAMMHYALALAESGWKVFPVYEPVGSICSCAKGARCKDAGKHPRITGWQKSASANAEQITRLWDRWPTASIGIPTGRISQNFVVDVDPRNGGGESLKQLTKRYGKLPETLIVETGGGGLHVYFAYPGRPLRTGAEALAAGIDIKSDGGFVVAPPSQHRSGGRYSWRADASQPLSPAPAWMLQRLTEKQRDGETEKQKQSLHVSDSLSLCQELIAPHIPDREGTRNRKIFNLARSLKSTFPDADPLEMRPFLVAWHRRALPNITTQDFADSWDEFLYAWPRVKFPKGQGTLDQILLRADQSVLPECGRRYESELMQRLLKLCRELHRECAPNPFFLSCRTVAELFKVDHETGAKRLKLLREHGIIRIAEAHTTTKATRYIYVGGK